MINFIKTLVDQLFSDSFKFKMISDFISAPGFHIKFPADITPRKAFLIQVIFLHQKQKNLFLRFRNQQKIAHFLLYLLMTTVLVNTVVDKFLFDFEESIGFVIHG